MKIWLYGLFILVVWTGHMYAQNDKIMTPEVYSMWNTIKNEQISLDGEIVKYELTKEVGDKTLRIFTDSTQQTISFPRVGQSSLLASGQWIVFTQKLSSDSLRVLKRNKTPKDKLPLDTLVLCQLKTGEIFRIPDVLSVKASDNDQDYIFYTKKITSEAPDSVTQSKKKNPCSQEYLVIKNLTSNKEDSIFNIDDFVFSRDSSFILYTTCEGDSIPLYNVFHQKWTTGEKKMIAARLSGVKNLSLSHQGGYSGFLGLKEKDFRLVPDYTLYWAAFQDTMALEYGINDITKDSMMAISAHRPLTWSESGQRMFFGLEYNPLPQDSSLLDDEIVDVEIWHYGTPRHYPQLNASLDKDKKKTYGVMMDLQKMTFYTFEDKAKDQSRLSVKGDGRYILQLRNEPYQKDMVWSGEVRSDIFVLDTKNGNSQLIILSETGQPVFSPEGKYVYWWSRSDSIWKSLDVESKVINYVGLWNFSSFHNEKNDIPMGPGPYGVAGWLKGDTSLIVYDRYDLWELKPNDPFYNRRLTDGRANKNIYRWIKLDDKEDSLNPDSLWFLHRVNETDKSEAYLYFSMKDTTKITLLTDSAWLSRKPLASARGHKFVFTKEDFTRFPDLWIADTMFKKIHRVSEANQQQAEFGWGSASLFKWTNYKNKPNEGLIFYPHDFDPEKKYPLIVNFYEKSSDGLYRHRAPSAHRSTINYSYYTNNGYIIFNPDIHYITGQPGQDCFDAVESGLDALIRTGYIDEEKIALQGHSWGGYQIAYLLTKSDRYACAESGAPVVNMVSAYGGIRWETGLSRMFQYEKTQSRLGVSLWENPDVYHKNSPIYQMDKVTAPVLILHNDNDGHVPWYQGIEYFMALRRLNKPGWLLNYKGEPHWPLKWENRLDFNIRMQEFFDHYLKGKPMPEWMLKGGSPLETVVRKQ